MLQNLCRLMICFGLSAFQLHAHTPEAHRFCRNEAQVVVSVSDLVVEQENILAKIDGFLCPVYSLERKGDTWIAGVDIAANYCPRGHPMCGICSLCHLEGCPYYVRPCWKK